MMLGFDYATDSNTYILNISSYVGESIELYYINSTNYIVTLASRSMRNFYPPYWPEERVVADVIMM